MCLNNPCEYESMVESDDKLFRRWKTRADWNTERNSIVRSRYTQRIQNTQYSYRNYPDNFLGASR